MCDVAITGIKSAFWRQLLADVLGAEIATVNSMEGAAYGVALPAGVGAEIWPTVEAAGDAVVRLTGTTEPGANRAIYEQGYPAYHGLYPALAATY